MVIFIRVNEFKWESWHFYVLWIEEITSLALLSRVWTERTLDGRIVDVLEPREIGRISKITASLLRCKIVVLLVFVIGFLSARISWRVTMDPSKPLLAWWSFPVHVLRLDWQAKMTIRVNITTCGSQKLFLFRVGSYWRQVSIELHVCKWDCVRMLNWLARSSRFYFAIFN